jgi:hypothetical protein
MRQAHGGVGFVDMLPARTPGSIRIDAQIFWSDIDLNRIVSSGTRTPKQTRCDDALASNGEIRTAMNPASAFL